MKTLCFLLALCSSTVAYAFSGQGAGTQNNPYLVSNADELFEVRNNLSAYYKQVDDIDLTAFIQADNPKLGWTAIGSPTSPFTGTYDGNNKTISGLYINRGTVDNIGLFSAVLDATIKNLAVVHPNITGQDYVAVIVGHWYYTTDSSPKGGLENIVIIGGTLSGSTHCASLIGGIHAKGATSITGYSTTYTITISKCYSSLTINASSQASGICDFAECGHIYWRSLAGTLYDEDTYSVDIQDTRFDGTIRATTCSGIVLETSAIPTSSSIEYSYPVLNITRCIMSGTLCSSGSTVYGISGANSVSISKSFVLADTLSAKSTIYRISDGVYLNNNYALTTSTLLINRNETDVDDNNTTQGISLGKPTLMKQSYYASCDFDFGEVWKMKEGETYPYLYTQSDPAVVTSFIGGSKGSISGTASGVGKVYVSVGSECYTAAIADNKWSVSVGNIAIGTEAKVSVAVDGLMPSIFVKATATEAPTVVTPTVVPGDANGDGRVDASDVVGVVNYLLGKPSATFNPANADANNDGQILVDDAVETINIITNQQ